MFDLAIALFGLRALRRAVGLRWWTGIVLAIASLGAWCVVAMEGWREHAAERFNIVGAWLLALFGPSAIGIGGVLLRAVATGCALGGFVLANRRHAGMSPLDHASVPWSDAALGFLVPFLLTGGEEAVFLAGRLLND